MSLKEKVSVVVDNFLVIHNLVENVQMHVKHEVVFAHVKKLLPYPFLFLYIFIYTYLSLPLCCFFFFLFVYHFLSITISLSLRLSPFLPLLPCSG